MHHPGFFAQCYLCSSLRQTHSRLCFPNSCLSHLTSFLFPLFLSILLLSIFPPLFPKCLLLFISHLLPPLSFYISLLSDPPQKAVKSNPLMGVLEVCCELPLSKSPADITVFCEALSMRQSHFISTVPNMPALLPSCLNELGLKWCQGAPQVEWAW